MNLIDLGWNQPLESQFESYKIQGFIPARVTREHKSNYTVGCEHGELTAEIAGKFRFGAQTKGDLPTVGDWVVISARPDESRATIHALLPRKSAFVRKAAGNVTVEQVIAANIDTVFIVTGLDGNFNVRRIERYLTLAWESGANPVVLLNKADLCDNIDARTAEVETAAIGVAVHALSARDDHGLEALAPYLAPGKTSAFLGSSGVGKSSIINCLAGEAKLPTGDVREDDSRGRHTTTSRELLLLPSGGIVIDTPGMREIQFWGDDEGLKQAFDDIEQLAAQCRFRDCSHFSEPGCAVREGIENGSLLRQRFESYLKLKKELLYLERRQAMKASAVEKLRWRQIAQFQKILKKGK